MFFFLYSRNIIYNNDFTFVSTKECSVVTYCLVQEEYLHRFSTFTVERSTEFIAEINSVIGLAVVSIPDHSVLSWTVEFGNSCEDPVENMSKSDAANATFDTFDVNSIPAKFMCLEEIISCINQCIFKIRQTLQESIDSDIDTHLLIFDIILGNKSIVRFHFSLLMSTIEHSIRKGK